MINKNAETLARVHTHTHTIVVKRTGKNGNKKLPLFIMWKKEYYKNCKF